MTYIILYFIKEKITLGKLPLGKWHQQKTQTINTLGMVYVLFATLFNNLAKLMAKLIMCDNILD
jgi:uncharacterized membrane protein